MANYRELFLQFLNISLLTKVLKFLRQIAFFNSFSFIYSTTLSVEYLLIITQKNENPLASIPPIQWVDQVPSLTCRRYRSSIESEESDRLQWVCFRNVGYWDGAVVGRIWVRFRRIIWLPVSMFKTVQSVTDNSTICPRLSTQSSLAKKTILYCYFKTILFIYLFICLLVSHITIHKTITRTRIIYMTIGRVTATAWANYCRPELGHTNIKNYLNKTITNSST
jgi:hypothetical protein